MAQKPTFDPKIHLVPPGHRPPNPAPVAAAPPDLLDDWDDQNQTVFGRNTKQVPKGLLHQTNSAAARDFEMARKLQQEMEEAERKAEEDDMELARRMQNQLNSQESEQHGANTTSRTSGGSDADVEIARRLEMEERDRIFANQLANRGSFSHRPSSGPDVNASSQNQNQHDADMELALRMQTMENSGGANGNLDTLRRMQEQEDEMLARRLTHQGTDSGATNVGYGNPVQARPVTLPIPQTVERSTSNDTANRRRSNEDTFQTGMDGFGTSRRFSSDGAAGRNVRGGAIGSRRRDARNPTPNTSPNDNGDHEHPNANTPFHPSGDIPVPTAGGPEQTAPKQKDKTGPKIKGRLGKMFRLGGGGRGGGSSGGRGGGSSGGRGGGSRGGGSSGGRGGGSSGGSGSGSGGSNGGNSGNGGGNSRVGGSAAVAPAPGNRTRSNAVVPKCDVCGKKALHYLAALDKKYHASCFTCMGCQRIIEPTESFAYTVTETGQKVPLHRSCHATLFGMKCSVCQDPIPYGEDGTISYVKHPFFPMEQMCPKHAHNPGRRCTGCHRFEPEGNGFADLGDHNRCVCMACCRTVIVDSADAKPLWDKVITFFDKKLGLTIWEGLRDIPVLVVGYDTLNERLQDSAHQGSTQIMTRGLCLSEHMSGRRIEMSRMKFDHSNRSFTPNDVESKGFTYFLVPDPSKTNPDSSVTAILCLSGLPADLTASVLAHEATHAWLKLHPKFSINKPIPLKVEEGVCQLMAHLFLTEGVESASTQSYEDGGPSDEKLRQYFKFNIETDENEIYGEGFRMAAKAHAQIGIEALLNHIAMYREFPNV